VNYQDIKRLVKLVETSAIDRIEIVEETFRISIEKNLSATSRPMPVPEQHYSVSAPLPVSAETSVAVNTAAATEADAGESGHTTTSPMVGTFYRAPSPDALPFVKEGDTVVAGQTICIIEAMKVMNEIEADISGVISKILVENAQAVQFDDPLFLIEPR